MELEFKHLSDLRVELVAFTRMDADGSSDARLVGSADFMPASAARVSHGREDKTGEEPDKDVKLMNYLADHYHLSPFEHQSATFLVEAPLYVAREWMRHRTQAFNEISMRYTSDPASTYYIPETFRAQATKNKQSSAGAVDRQDMAAATYKQACVIAHAHYQQLLDGGTARELARGILPTAMVTRFYATANLRNWAGWYHLRKTDDAQVEIRHYAERINTMLKELWPDSWGVLTND